MSEPTKYNFTGEESKSRIFGADDQRKHLDYLQAAITRMNSNSFTIKGWAITLVTALFAFVATVKIWWLLIVVVIPIIALWILDSIYLEQERVLRAIYNDVRLPDPQSEPYQVDMELGRKLLAQKNAASNDGKGKGAYTSNTIIGFYLPLLLISLVVGGLIFYFMNQSASSATTTVSIKDTVKTQVVK